ncbi:hypothetical protein DD985_21640 [Pseudomonas sp. HMWF011]|nr:hypothetical protein H098_13445 [Pseudomonas fluorescens FH5]PTT08123.1 hypothetical protein DBR14_23470 [Pseudomonas sp. HMWF034]PVV67303.1 hypothetical protein DD985_21640 [Pseudomonas sp. HMWF011]
MENSVTEIELAFISNLHELANKLVKHFYFDTANWCFHNRAAMVRVPYISCRLEPKLTYHSWNNFHRQNFWQEFWQLLKSPLVI